MTTPLGQYLTRPPRYGIGAAATAYRADLPVYIRITDVDEFGRFKPDPIVSVDSPLSSNYLLRDGDIVVARTGASVGKSYRYRSSDGYLVFAGFLIAICPDSKRLDPRYLAYTFQSKQYWDWITSESMRSGQPGINAQQIASLEIDAPDIEAQREVADKLEDVDNLIESLEGLIAKKRGIKQGIMQELLTGHTRLPGFSGDWETVPFEKLAMLVTERVDPRTIDPTTQLIELENVESASGRLLGAGVAGDAVSLKAIFRPGDVLFGKLRSYLRKYWLADSDGVCSTEIWVLRAREGARGGFLRCVVESDQFIEATSGGYGTRMPRADWSVVRNLVVSTPPPNEQDAIAEVLLDADEELSLLEHRLESARAVKTGMMQELLTGRTRLPVEGAS